MPDATPTARPGATPRSLSRTVTVAAPPGEVFALLADPRRHPELDGSGTVRGAVEGPPRLSLGTRFGMRMRYPGPLGFSYRITNRVVEFEEGRRIAWRHFGRHVWRWELEPVEVGGRRGTRVTETFDWGPSLAPRVLELGRYPARNAKGVNATLRRLQERFGTLPA